MCVKCKDDFDMIALQLVSSDSSGVEMPNLKLKDHHFSFVLFWAREHVSLSSNLQAPRFLPGIAGPISLKWEDTHIKFQKN